MSLRTTLEDVRDAIAITLYGTWQFWAPAVCCALLAWLLGRLRR